MKVIDQINRDLERLANTYATDNAHGIPASEKGYLKLISMRYLVFEPHLTLTSPDLPRVLREIANILEKYF